MPKMRPILLGEITRLLRIVRNLHGRVYVVGGIVTEGMTARDIDIVITDIRDIDSIKKALGKFAGRTHFIQQKTEPPATLFLKVTGKEGTSPDLFKEKGQIPKDEYAS